MDMFFSHYGDSGCLRMGSTICKIYETQASFPDANYHVICHIMARKQKKIEGERVRLKVPCLAECLHIQKALQVFSPVSNYTLEILRARCASFYDGEY